MPIPYFPQKHAWTCGASAMRMALQALGIKKSEVELARLLGTNQRVGTPNRAFSAAAKRLGLSYIVRRNATFTDLKNTLRQGYLVIIGYVPKEGEGHFAVVQALTKTHLQLLDPAYGARTAFTRAKFQRLWRSYYDCERRWYFGIKR